MIIKSELIKKIRTHFSLNIYETKVWLALLGRGLASAGETAEISGVPRSRTYDVLESLEKQGFAILKLGKPVKYIAVKPRVILEKLKTNTMKYAEERVNSLSKLKETQEYTELQELYKTGIKPIKNTDLSGAIKGKSTIYSHIRELLENAEKEVVICLPAKELLNKARLFSQVFMKLNKHNIKIKIALSGEEKEIKKINIKFKINAKKINIESRFFIVDNNQVLFMLSNDAYTEEDSAIWLNTSFFATALTFLFEQAWKK